MEIKIIKQNFFYNGGAEGVSYAIQVNGQRRIVYYTLDEVKAFLRGVYGKD